MGGNALSDQILVQIVNHPVFIAGASVAVVAIVNAIVRNVGKGAKTPARLASLEKHQQTTAENVAALAVMPDQVRALEKRQASTEDLNRLTLRVLDHQSAGIRAILEVHKGKINGNVDDAIRRMDEAEKDTKDFLFGAAVPQEVRS